jgi:hypothetical protein
MIGPDPNYQPPQYEAKTTRKGQRLHGYATNHSGDWKPALVSRQYRDNYDVIFRGETDDDKQVEMALKHFKQDCCAGSCDCSMRKTK